MTAALHLQSIIESLPIAPVVLVPLSSPPDQRSTTTYNTVRCRAQLTVQCQRPASALRPPCPSIRCSGLSTQIKNVPGEGQLLPDQPHRTLMPAIEASTSCLTCQASISIALTTGNALGCASIDRHGHRLTWRYRRQSTRQSRASTLQSSPAASHLTSPLRKPPNVWRPFCKSAPCTRAETPAHLQVSRSERRLRCVFAMAHEVPRRLLGTTGKTQLLYHGGPPKGHAAIAPW